MAVACSRIQATANPDLTPSPDPVGAASRVGVGLAVDDLVALPGSAGRIGQALEPGPSTGCEILVSASLLGLPGRIRSFLAYLDDECRRVRR